jgi:nucleoside-diphosphate-sugar epimerase
MVRNVLTALRGHRVQHVALVTGLKHYLGPVEAQGRVAVPDTPFREDEPRLPVENFYYVQEDEVFAAAEEQGFTWSVHRPHTIIGYALGNAMNIGVTLAVAATICRETGRPFIFPGSTTQWKSLKDMTDARLLARHLAWASRADNAKNEAFNVVNGDIFHWRRMWSRIAEYFGVEPVAPSGEPYPFEQQMADTAPIWEDTVHRYGLAESDLDRLVSWWHTDGDLGRDIECVTDICPRAATPASSTTSAPTRRSSTSSSSSAQSGSSHGAGEVPLQWHRRAHGTRPPPVVRSLRILAQRALLLDHHEHACSTTAPAS